MKIVLFIIGGLILVFSGGVIGWILGMRDGVTTAYAQLNRPLTAYHVASGPRKELIRESAMESITGSIVCHLLHGDNHAFPTEIPSSQATHALQYLRAVWQPSKKHVMTPGVYFPHESKGKLDYKDEFYNVVPVTVEEAAEFTQYYDVEMIPE